MGSSILIRGAREHNLKNIHLEIPRNKLVVITGLSGSGKSSLAFDTIYAEGQRRYLESLSAYARQFLDQMKKPAVDSIDGLSPSISIEQKQISRNPRSTVGTVTEIYDYLRLLFARVGVPHCPSCGKAIKSQSVSQIVDQILQRPEGTRFAVLAPIVRGKKGEYQKELQGLRARGYGRARIDGEEVSLSDPIRLKKTNKHDISIYIDRLILKPSVQARLAEAVDLAVQLAEGLAEVEFLAEKEISLFSTKFACIDCGTSFSEIEPRIFSFNSPHGACESCDGLGVEPVIDVDKIVPNPNLSLYEGAILPWADKSEDWKTRVFETLAKKFGFDPAKPFGSLPENIRKILLYGSEEELDFEVEKGKGSYSFRQAYEGIVPSLKAELKEGLETNEEVLGYLTYSKCNACLGTRLRSEALNVLLNEKNISTLCDLDLIACRHFLEELRVTESQRRIAEPILKETLSRLGFLENVGLGYLTLNRAAASLSGGEAQRIRLATQIGSPLVGVLYVLDEPSIGLHQRDNDRLITTLENLRDQGNSVLVVEHDQETIERADFVVDLGPGAGVHGGNVLFHGPPALLPKTKNSLTADYLARRKTIPVPEKRRESDKWLRISKATLNNLKNIDVSIPIGCFTCVTGVSGSGKSSLIIDSLLPALTKRLYRGGGDLSTPHFEKVEGLEHLNKVIHIDQSPIGRTPRSNPANYTGTFSDIRLLFSNIPEAKMKGYAPGRFSFNVSGGRCEDCTGDGNIRVSMNFLPDVYVLCEFCSGKRYNRETLEILYRGKNIADVLSMTIEDAYSFFERHPTISVKLKTLLEVGLGYIELGQSAVTLSGGEAQRIKLARELARRATGKTLYVLDEPTTGLHFEDVRKLLEILQALVNQGNTVIVIEHSLDVIKQADHLVDLGPEGGEAGGKLLYQGTPEGIVKLEGSSTGIFLGKVLRGV